MTIDKEKLLKGLTVCTRPGIRTCFLSKNVCPYDENGCKMGMMKDAIVLIKEQNNIIEKYHKADGFLDAHGWKW